MSTSNQYSQDQIQKIKGIVSGYLDSNTLMERIKDKIRDENIDPKQLNDKKLLEILKQTDMFDKISHDVKGLITTKKEKVQEQPPVNTSAKRALLVKVGQGKAFLQYMGGESNKKLQFYINFLKGRYTSNLVPASVEPNFNSVSFVEKTAGI